MKPLRLLGLDRSGPPPPETRAGQPLRPWTIPNAIGFVRLALIPVFLIVALSSDDGSARSPAILFAVIGWGDYADGIAARVTGQYSRLGALMDPITDRLLVISRRGRLLALRAAAALGAGGAGRARAAMLASGATGSRTASSCASTGPGGWPWRR